MPCAISGNGGLSLAVRADGTVWNWGQRVSAPVQVAGLTDVAAVAAGWNHALALKHDGTVWAWGNNTTGQLGDGTTTNRTTPAPVLGLSGVTSLAAGDGFSLAVQGDGASGGLVWAWGTNTTGQLGDGSLLTRLVPVRVIGLDAVAQVAAGMAFGVARLADGTVRAWGADDSLQLGDVSAATSPCRSRSPCCPTSSGSPRRMRHAVAIDDEGRAWGWGCERQRAARTTELRQRGRRRCSGADAGRDRGHRGVGRHVGHAAPASGRDGLVHGLVERHTRSRDGDPFVLTRRQHVAVRRHGHRWAASGGRSTSPAPMPCASTPTATASAIWSTCDAAARARIRTTTPTACRTSSRSRAGTDPFRVDTDGDGVSDLADAFPLDATRWLAPVVDPNDHTPPVITLTYPTSARPIGGGL